jgi:hypothetical protein
MAPVCKLCDTYGDSVASSFAPRFANEVRKVILLILPAVFWYPSAR